MPEISNSRRRDETMERIAETLQHGLLLVDAEGEVLWMDEQTRRRINGGLSMLPLPFTRRDRRPIVDCFLTTAQVELESGPQNLCVIQALAPAEASQPDIRSLVYAIEDVMAEASWFTQPLLDKLKARLQAGQPQPARRSAELERLTAREREILALVCEGRTDAEMGRLLKLSQNTVRNHLASLFRKIGVNRRSAAVIWARERALTKHDLAALSAAPPRDQ
jgi:DNA-binding CsgD family transcriptional regulator